jgi:hypothetical protein
MRREKLVTLLLAAAALVMAQPRPGGEGLGVTHVAVSATSFNPTTNQKVDVVYTLSKPAAVTVKIFDPDQYLIRTLCSKAARKRGVNRETWDGKDMDGKIVPNEAYFLTIEAEGGPEKAVYDPITFSGGESFDVMQGKVSRESGTISYQLSQPSRVLLRIGIPGAILLRTVVDWEPRVGGEIVEYWNGKDEDGVTNIWDDKTYRMVLTYFTLPENSVISFGNSKYDYRKYRAQWKTPWPKKEDRAMVNQRRLSPHFLRSRLVDHSFKVQLSFPDAATEPKTGLSILKGKPLARIDVSDADRAQLLGHPFETILFVDKIFVAEQERGYLPLTLPWELGQLPPGEHVLSINIMTFDDQIGVGSRKVKVVK